MRHEQPRVLELAASDGVRLAVHRLGPQDAPKVVLVPGTFSNHTFWLGTRGRGFARTLALRGWEAWVLDARGHGASQRPRAGDRWRFDDWARRDVPAAIAAAAEASPGGARVRLVGHSAGGAALLAALAGEPRLEPLAAGLAILGTPVPWLQPWRGAGARLIRAVTLAFGRFPARLLRLGPEDELPGVMTQWMDWNLAGRWTGDDGTDYSAGLRRLRLPVLAVAGAGDRFFAPPFAVRALFEWIGSGEKRFVLAARETGFAVDYGHPGLIASREAEREIWPLLVDWLEATAAP